MKAIIVLLLMSYQISFGQNQETPILDLKNVTGFWYYKGNVDKDTRLFYRKTVKKDKVYFGHKINIIKNGDFTEQRTVPCGNDNSWRYKKGIWNIENENILNIVYSSDSTAIKYKILKLSLDELILSEIKD